MNPFAPSGFGVGLRHAHYLDLLNAPHGVDWVEVHSENYFGNGGHDLHVLETVRRDLPISLHGVGLGLGSTTPLDVGHLGVLKRLVEPAVVSEHLCWGATSAGHLNDLLPMPLTRAALNHLCPRLSQVQEVLGRPILIENVSTYLRFEGDQYGETTYAYPVLLALVGDAYFDALSLAYACAYPSRSNRAEFSP